MDSDVCLQVAFFIERFLALLVGAHELFYTVVSIDVYHKPSLASERLVAAFERTLKFFVLPMNFSVILEMSFRHETLGTAREFTFKGAVFLKIKC